MFAGCTHQPAVDLAERLVGALPAGLTRIFYSDNGSTAVEVAVKLAVQYWRNQGQPDRQRIVALHHAYHGDTVGAMSVSEDSVFTRAFAPLLFPVDRVHAPYCYRCPLGLARDVPHRLPRATSRTTLKTPRRPRRRRARRADAAGRRRDDHVAGGVSRRRSPAVRSLRRADDRRRSAHRIRAHRPHVRLRARPRHARHHLSVEGADGRLPAARRHRGHRRGLRRVPQRRPQQDVLPRPLVHGQPARVRGGLASLDLFKENDVLARIARLETQLREGLAPLSRLPMVGDVRVLGGVGAIELVSDKTTKSAGGTWTRSVPVSRRPFSSAACCSVRSATSSTSCRPTSSRTTRWIG